MKKNFDAIIFDMDGVLVTNFSYCLAIKKTVETIVEMFYGFKVQVDDSEISALKKITGFNNDWDASYALIELLGQGINKERFEKNVKLISTANRNTNKYKKIKNLFQAYYLGEKIFSEVYKKKPPITIQQGLIESETLLIEMELLRLLRSGYKLGIATSRPRFEAIYALKNQSISPEIIDERYVIAKEDALREKPDPAPLLTAKKRLKAKTPVYIGDTINDVVAAKKAQMPCIYIGEQKWGDYQFININQIKEVLL